jgi:hypothetical protein
MGMIPSHGVRFPGLSAVGQSPAALAAGLADPAAQAASLAALGYQHGGRSNEAADSLASLHYQLGLAAKSWGIKAATVVNQAVSATAGVGQKTVTTTGNAFALANVGDQFSLQGAGAAYSDASGAFPLVSTIATKTDNNTTTIPMLRPTRRERPPASFTSCVTRRSGCPRGSFSARTPRLRRGSACAAGTAAPGFWPAREPPASWA